ncbi:MAG: hypothetical protein JRM80_00210 [Nitrososphaerota archaeon]|nr:hypothetical protein [Nitrososphaerota archaeon]
MSWRGAAFAFCLALALSLLVEGSASAQSGPDWSGVAEVPITTTDGPTTQAFTLQTARAGDEIFFRVQFDYTGAASPGEVFFAVELGRYMNVTSPMSQGDEMMIASQQGPDGKTPKTYDYYLSSAESEPDAVVPGSVTVETVSITGSHYEMVFSRPMTTGDPARQVQLQDGQAVPLSFAVSEWGAGSSHAYTWFTYQMNITQSQVVVGEHRQENGGDQPLPAEVMMITQDQAAVEIAVIFAVLFVSVLYLGTKARRGA